MIPTVKNVFLLTIGSYSMSSSLNAANLATTTFQVLMTVTSSCQVSVNSDINLGSVSLNTSNPSSKTTLSVTCSKNIPFSIGLSPSALNSGTDDGTGTLSSVTNSISNTDKIPYQLKQSSATGSHWGKYRNIVNARKWNFRNGQWRGAKFYSLCGSDKH
ncbi:spore coat U domain-containing protein [Providencia stuartii]|uniref:Csu type fimbrial protein n=1 Tax=Providencia stuartii TaxID=588 RepID=UPI002FF7960A